MGAPQLNIKDAETTRMVRELAELTGETQTEVVRKAVKERLAREKDQHEQATDRNQREKQIELQKALDEIRQIQDRVKAAGLIENMLTDDDLYDENGLPR